MHSDEVVGKLLARLESLEAEVQALREERNAQARERGTNLVAPVRVYDPDGRMIAILNAGPRGTVGLNLYGSDDTAVSVSCGLGCAFVGLSTGDSEWAELRGDQAGGRLSLRDGKGNLVGAVQLDPRTGQVTLRDFEPRGEPAPLLRDPGLPEGPDPEDVDDAGRRLLGEGPEETG